MITGLMGMFPKWLMGGELMGNIGLTGHSGGVKESWVLIEHCRLMGLRGVLRGGGRLRREGMLGQRGVLLVHE